MGHTACPHFWTFAESLLREQWAHANLPDRLLPSGAEWACIRELRRDADGAAEARALLASVRTVHDWRISRAPRALGGSPESDMLLEALAALDALSTHQDRKPLRAWLESLDAHAEAGQLYAAGVAKLPALHGETLRRLGAHSVVADAGRNPVAIAVAQDDEHELELIAAWCRTKLTRDPSCRLLVVDANLRQRRSLYDRVLSQTLTPSAWIGATPRAISTTFAIEGGRSLAEFPLVAQAMATLRLLVGRLRFDEVVRWLRQPFLDGPDLMAGAAVEAFLRGGRKLDFNAEELAATLEGGGGLGSVLAVRLRQALDSLAGWPPQCRRMAIATAQLALRQLGWHRQHERCAATSSRR
jgi:hypothetical protein